MKADEQDHAQPPPTPDDHKGGPPPLPSESPTNMVVPFKRGPSPFAEGTEVLWSVQDTVKNTFETLWFHL